MQPNSNKPHINTFIKGMDKDTAFSKFENIKYEHAENLRLLTEDGKSTGALINVQGNEKLLSIPPVVTITLPTGDSLVEGASLNLNVTSSLTGLRGTISIAWQSSASTNPEGWGIIDPFNNLQNYIYYIKNDSVVIEITNYEEVLALAQAAGLNDLEFSYDQGFNLEGFTPQFYYAKKYFIIGSTTLRDDIILFTTENGDDVGGPGYIWRVNYDKATFNTTTKLAYSDHALNFSTKYLVEAAARYETDKIERLYWTDNFNPIRSFNLLDEELWDLRINSIEFNPAVTLIPGKCSKIGAPGSGNLDIGTYQMSYRLTTFAGQKTEIAPWSVPISINAPSESGKYENYQRASHDGPAVFATKAIEYTIDKVTAGFDTMEIFLRKSGTSSDILYFVDTLYLNGSTDPVSINITGSSGAFTEIQQFTLQQANATFNVCKTLTIKDNRLIVGNVKSRNTFLNYDATAPRYNPDLKPHEKYNNPYNKDSSRNVNSLENQYRYQIAFNGTKGVLGGGNLRGGDKVQYRFITKEIDLDRYSTFNNKPSFPVLKEPRKISEVVFNENNTTPNSVFYAGNLWNNFKNPYIEHLIKGYQRDEVYRFGVLFYDKSSKPIDVKWIGDIRMPMEIDEGFEITEEKVSINEQQAELVGKVLGVEFIVDVEEIRDQISGFSIVRAPRPNKDKTILGQGMIGEHYAYINNPYFARRWNFDFSLYQTLPFVDRENDTFRNDAETVWYTDMFANEAAFNLNPLDLGRNQLIEEKDVTGWTLKPEYSKWSKKIDDPTDLNYRQYKWDTWLNERYALAPYTPLTGPLARLNWLANINYNDNASNNEFGTSLSSSGEVRQLAWMASPDLENGSGLSSQYGKIIGPEETGLANIYAGGVLQFKPIKELNTTIAFEDLNSAKTTTFGEHPHTNLTDNWIGGDNAAREYHIPPSGVDVGYSAVADYSNNNKEFDIRFWRGYTNKRYYNPFTNSRQKHYTQKITHGVTANDYADNFLIGNDTQVDKLGMDSTTFFYQCIEAGSRSNFAALPILKSDKYWSNVASLFTNTDYPWNDKDKDHNRARYGYPIVVGNIYVNNESQYGGNGQNDIDNTEYISTGHYQEVSDEDGNIGNRYYCEVFGGDTMINIYSQMLTYPSERIDAPIKDIVQRVIEDEGDDGVDTSERVINMWKQWEFFLKELVKSRSFNYTAINFPVETTVNNLMEYNKDFNYYVTRQEIETRSLNSANGTWSLATPTTQSMFGRLGSTSVFNGWPFAFTDTGKLSVYQWENAFRPEERLDRDLANFARENFARKYLSLGTDTLLSTEFDNRVYASEVKSNGEQKDSWVIFKPNVRKDVDGHHGPINKLEVFNDQLYYFQDTGFGLISVNPRALMPSPDLSQLLLGDGRTLDDFKYISTEIGSRHQWSIIKSKTGIYFFDATSRKFYRTRGTGEPLSDMKGMSAFFYNNINRSALTYDNSYHEGGIIGTFDPRYNEIIYTFHDKDSSTIVDDTTTSTPVYSSPPWEDSNWETDPTSTGVETFFSESAFVLWDAFTKDITDFDADNITPDTEWAMYFIGLNTDALGDATPSKIERWLQTVDAGRDVRFVMDGEATGGRTVAEFGDPVEVQVIGTYLVSGQFRDTQNNHVEFNNPPLSTDSGIERKEVDFFAPCENPYRNFWGQQVHKEKPIVLIRFKIPQSSLLERVRTKMKAAIFNEPRGWVSFVISAVRGFAFYYPAVETIEPPVVIEETTVPVLDRSSIVYSEAIDAFTGFYSFRPKIFIKDDARYFSPNPEQGKDLYIHNKGNKCIWYDRDASDSVLKFIVNPKGYNSKIFNNIEFLTQVTTSEGENILQESFNQYTIENEYQNVTKQLIPYTEALTSPQQLQMRRRMRNWRFQVPRNGDEKARIRNPYVSMSFVYNNNEDKEITINDIITYYMDVPM
jgi:hypothetical protein